MLALWKCYALVFDYKTGSAWGYKAEILDNATLGDHAHAAFGAHVMPRAESISRLLIFPVLVANYEALIPGAATFTPNMDVTVAPQVVGGTGHIALLTATRTPFPALRLGLLPA